MAEKVKRP